MPSPSHVPSSAISSCAPGSPCCATRVINGPSISFFAPPAACTRGPITGSPAAARRLAVRTSAVPEVYCSRQPLRPHPHHWPSGTAIMCATSPANPSPPRISCPSRTIAPPRPVPRVTISMCLASVAAPKRYSAHPAAFASFSTTTGSPVSRSSSSARGRWRHARFAANRTVRRSALTKPAAPTPTPTTSCSARSSATASATPASISSASVAGVLRVVAAMIPPSSSTTPAAILVPPMSTPMESMLLLPDHC